MTMGIMMQRLLFALTAAFAMTIAPPSQAQNRQPVDHPIYEGLLPEGFQIQQAPLDRAALAGRKLVMVPSANFNQYTETWIRGYDPENRNFAQSLMGFDAADMESQRVASDPRSFSDRVTETLRPYFSAIEVAPDLATARERGADYYAVVDLWGAFSPMGGRYRTHGGVHLLDGQLRQVLSVTAVGDVRRHEPSMFESLRTGFRAVLDATGQTMADGIDATATPVLQQLGEQLGPPPPAQ